MSAQEQEIARLRRALEQAKVREEQAKAREEQAKAREEQAKAREEQERREKEQERREKEQLLHEYRKTTLHEYLRNCHSHLYTNLRIADPSISSTGFTKVEGKFYPKRLRLWTAFETSLWPRHFDFITRICGERELFHRKSTTMDLGATISRKLAGNENAIDNFEKVAVENAVWDIISILGSEEEARAEYGFTGFRFSNNTREFAQLSDLGEAIEEDANEEQPEQRHGTGPNKRVASERRVQPISTKPDGWGFRTSSRGDESLAFVYDYKAARKVAVEHLRPALAQETLFMEVIQRINSDKTWNDSEMRAQEKTEALIAMALTQVFHYMVTSGLSHGYVAAGQSLLFLHIDRTDPQTLYCHPCIPSEDSRKRGAGDWENIHGTAVAQLVIFCLLSFQSNALTGSALDAALIVAEATLKRWKDPYEDAAGLGAEFTDSSSASSSQATDGSEFTSVAAPTGRVVQLRSRSSCASAAVLPRDEDDDEENRPEFRPPGPSTDTGKRKERPSSDSSEAEDVDMSEISTRQYCTQACLLGLKHGWDLDDTCPNTAAHRTVGHMARHPVNADEFAHLVSEQLRQNPYRYCWALDGWHKRGAIAVLFKLVLARYGYVFVGKGTPARHLRRLEHEGRIYMRLNNLQGKVVPVHLGLVSLDRGYVFPGGDRVVHMMLMSWGGEAADVSTDAAAKLKTESLGATWAEGVDHGDDCEANFLWNAECRRVMVIDFDRAVLRPTPKPQQLSKLSRKRKYGGN